MNSRGYNDDLGPRIDLGSDTGSAPAMGDIPSQPAAPPTPPLPSRKAPKSGGSSALAVVSLIIALVSLAVAAWAIYSRPETIPGPVPSPEVVPGGTAERTAKLEKDVGGLMLRLVTLEKEIQAVKGKAGSITKLTELNARVQALQGRMDSLDLESKVASLKAGRSTAPKPKESTPQAKPAEKPSAPASPKVKKPQPKQKKLEYVVRRGDTLFTVAQRYKVRISDLKRWNKLKKNHILKVNEKLIIYK